jgi:hypothetical protein
MKLSHSDDEEDIFDDDVGEGESSLQMNVNVIDGASRMIN